MLILITRTKCFISNTGGQQLTLSPGPSPAKVPDWVRDTGTFQLGLTDGSVQEIQVVSPVPVAAVATAKPQVPYGLTAPAPSGPRDATAEEIAADDAAQTDKEDAAEEAAQDRAPATKGRKK